MSTTVSPNPLKPVTELPAQDHPITLRCRACKKTAKYKVGRMIVQSSYVKDPQIPSPEKLFRSLAKIDWAKYVAFSGYFVCKGCGSGGPWDIPPAGKREIAMQMIRHAIAPDEVGIFIGKAVLFDGTSWPTGYASAEHLQKLISADPTNSFLWSRLGNTYIGADVPELALPAFNKAIELEPLDMESLHSLGAYYFDVEDYETAARYFHGLLTNCREGTWYRKEIKENLLLNAVESLLDISIATKQRIPLFPRVRPSTPDGAAGRTPELHLHTFDLSKESERRRLVNLFLQPPPAKLPTLHKNWLQQSAPAIGQARKHEEARPLTSGDRVGRNDPCPCGSGKKYKKCCYS